MEATKNIIGSDAVIPAPDATTTFSAFANTVAQNTNRFVRIENALA